MRRTLSLVTLAARPCRPPRKSDLAAAPRISIAELR